MTSVTTRAAILSGRARVERTRGDSTAPPGRRKNENATPARSVRVGRVSKPHGGLASSRERTSGQDCVPRATRALERGTASTPVASASFDVSVARGERGSSGRLTSIRLVAAVVRASCRRIRSRRSTKTRRERRSRARVNRPARTSASGSKGAHD